MANIRGGSGTIGGYYYGQNYYAGMPSLSKQYLQVFSDSIAIADIATKVGFKSLIDGLSITDTYSRIITLLRSYSDGISISDIAGKYSIKSPFIDGIQLSENFSFLKVLLQFFSDGIGLVDNWSRKFDGVRSLVDSLSIADAIQKHSIKNAFVDSMSLIDSLNKKSIKTFSDGIDLLDNFIKGLYFTLVFSDGVQLADTYVKNIGRNIADVFTMADSAIRDVTRSFVDSMKVSDVFSKTYVVFLALVDGILMTDYASKQIDKLFEEGIKLSESVLKNVNIILVSAVSIRDSITRRLNGMIINWEKIKSLIGDWIKRDKKNDGLTKMQRQEIAWSKQGQAIETFTKQEKDVKDWTKFKDINDNE